MTKHTGDFPRDCPPLRGEARSRLKEALRRAELNSGRMSEPITLPLQQLPLRPLPAARDVRAPAVAFLRAHRRAEERQAERLAIAAQVAAALPSFGKTPPSVTVIEVDIVKVRLPFPADPRGVSRDELVRRGYETRR